MKRWDKNSQKLKYMRVIATTSNDDKANRLKAAGADAVINYREIPPWHLAVRELTGGRGVDQVVEIGGGTLEQSYNAQPSMVRLILLVACPMPYRKSTLTCSTTRSRRSASFLPAVARNSSP